LCLPRGSPRSRRLAEDDAAVKTLSGQQIHKTEDFRT
jgi:hypothetical protein